MAHKRNELVPVGEVIADLPGPVQALCETPPPARRGFTVADQVNQLVWASEAAPDRGFMARMMALCSLHHHLAIRVLVEAAHLDLSDTLTVHGVPLNPICQEEPYNPGRDVSTNPNKDSILTL